jgi:DNA-binding response OmpR family regulator
MPRVFLVHDRGDLGHYLREALDGAGPPIESVEGGLDRLAAAGAGFAVVLLDNPALQARGAEFLEELRRRRVRVPVVLVTAHGAPGLEWATDASPAAPAPPRRPDFLGVLLRALGAWSV